MRIVIPSRQENQTLIKKFHHDREILHAETGSFTANFWQSDKNWSIFHISS